MSDKLPPLPNADLIVFDAALQSPLEGVTTANVRAYGQQCYSRGYQQAKEEAARETLKFARLSCPADGSDRSRFKRALNSWASRIAAVLRAMEEPSHD